MTQLHDQSAEVIDNIVELVDGMERSGEHSHFDWPSSDPIEHFGLATNPFADNVNPEFFFRTESHEEAFVLMKRAIEDHASLGLCTALSGTGKTLLTQILLQELDPDRQRPILILVYPGMSRSALLREIIAELGLDTPSVRASIHNLLSIIQEEIIRLYREGIKLVLIIDECHFLKVDSLHVLRTLSNIEIPERKLITVLLFGEDHFRTRLERKTYRALLSRMFVRCTINPLGVEELRQYIKFRCLMAGGNSELFTPDSFAPIAEVTGGIPREVNRLAHNALLAAARRRMDAVNGDLIKTLIKQGVLR